MQIEFKSDRNNRMKELAYRNEKKRVNEALIEGKNSYFRDEFIKTKGNIKGTWNVVHKIIHNNKSLISRNVTCSENEIHKKG